MPKFSERLKSLRAEKCISQADLAKQIKLSKSSINMYERGEREPGLETLERIADFFNVDMDYLLGKSDIVRKVHLHDSVEYVRALCKDRDNVLRIAGRDGSYHERILTDKQKLALEKFLDLLPDVPDDL